MLFKTMAVTDEITASEPGALYSECCKDSYVQLNGS